jgi:hypothetical protein
MARRVCRASVACWHVRGGQLPSGVILAIFVLACFCVSRSLLEGQPINIVDAAFSLVLGCVMASTFLAALFGKS